MASDGESEVPLTPKERAKKQRRKAYERAKELRKSDPRYLAAKEKQRQVRRAAYQKVKDAAKIARVARKKAADAKSKAERAQKDQALRDQLYAASTLNTNERAVKSSQAPEPPLFAPDPAATTVVACGSNVIPFRRQI